jgi:hypothetical protein
VTFSALQPAQPVLTLMLSVGAGIERLELRGPFWWLGWAKVPIPNHPLIYGLY